MREYNKDMRSQLGRTRIMHSIRLNQYDATNQWRLNNIT